MDAANSHQSRLKTRFRTINENKRNNYNKILEKLYIEYTVSFGSVREITLKKRGENMAKINLDEGTIQVSGEWLTRDEIVARIQEMMSTGNMRIGTLASSLEWLETELEGSEEIHVVIPRPTVLGIDKVIQTQKISIGDVVRNALTTYLRGRSGGQEVTEDVVEEEEEEEE